MFKVTNIKLEGEQDGHQIIASLIRRPGEPKRVTLDVFNLTHPTLGQGQGLVIDPENNGHRHMMTDHLMRLFGVDRMAMDAAHVMELVEYVCK